MAELPPSVPRDPTLHAKLEAALAAKGPEYEPRTDLKDGDAPRYLNRLILEPSPYLLQHAHNPVDWWPWGDAAMVEAARRNVPLFISAGYATCHWCHVMEEESFDNEHVAALLNANFLAIKLDREQRPDIDQIYLTATSVQKGHAGWPNSIWATPDGKPFHTGTYFPRPQFLEILTGIAHGWREKQAEFEAFADRFAAQLQTITRQRAEAADLAGLPDAALVSLKHAHNPSDGGFSSGTQFPHEGFLLFLIDHWRRGGDGEALAIARRSLDAMAEGGFHDHIGGGFHRYTVDVNWRTPHFEKMLYNQALLMQCYTQLWQITHAPEHARSVSRCVEYLRRDMTAPDGAFYSAEDADSLDANGQREEGAFYVWSPEAATKVLGKDASELIEWLNLRASPTLEAGPIAHLAPGARPDFATLDPMLEKLREAREARPRPIRDSKVIGGWNGLMIRALTEAGQAFDRDDWTAMAERAATAVFSRLTTKTGLARFHAEGTPVEDANLTDYAWLALACVALYDANADDSWLTRAIALTDTLLERFSTENGRLALVRDGTPFGPVFEMEDGAVPSGESSALELLALLEARAPDAKRRSAADALAAALSGAIAKNPTTRLPAITAWRSLSEGESGSARSHAGGALQTELKRVAGHWHLHVHPAPGWHISASNENGLAAARLEGAQTTWPKPKPWPSPLGDDLPAYTDSLELVLAAPENTITLHLQLCSETECLAPTTIKYRLQ